MFGLSSDVGPGSSNPGKSCQTCEYWSGEITEAGCAVCWHRYPQQMVKPFPKKGCVFWLRAIGSDDEMVSP